MMSDVLGAVYYLLLATGHRMSETVCLCVRVCACVCVCVYMCVQVCSAAPSSLPSCLIILDEGNQSEARQEVAIPPRCSTPLHASDQP